MPINVNAMTEQQQITAIYVAYYDRAPDPAGLQYWVDQLQGGRSLAQIASDFSEAAETKAKYPYFDTPDVASADTFITGIYTNLFGRTPDDAGREFWSGQLESGSTPVGEIILAILEGAQSAADGGFPDEATVNNKIEVGLDWAQSAIEAGIGLSSNPIAEEVDGEVVVNNNEAFDSATGVLDNVDGTADSVTDAKAETDTFVAGGGGSGDTFTLTTSADSVDEGGSVVFTLDSENVSAGEEYSYSITGVDSADVDGSLTGTAKIGADGKATIAVNLNADETTEGAETLTLSVAGETADVTVNDTSTTPVQPVSDFSLTAASTSVDEGDSVVFTLTDANEVANGDTFTFDISGVSSDDVDGSRTGTVTVDSNGEAKITVDAVADETTEGAETLTLSVAGETADVTVNDTSTTPTDLTLTTDSDSVEGTDADETVTGTFANDGAGNDLGNIQLSDSIDLGSGDDTAEIRLTQDMDNTLAPEFENVENIVLNDRAGVTVDAADLLFTSATSVTLSNGTLASVIQDLEFGDTSVTANGTSGNVTLTGTGDTATVSSGTVDGATLDVDTATTLAFEATGAVTLADIADQDLETLNISGSGAFTLEDAGTEQFTTISASANTGGVTLEQVDATGTSVTGTAADDVVETTGALDFANDDISLDGGDGSDTLSIDTDIVDGDGVSNFETVEIASTGLEFALDSVDGVTAVVIATPGADGGVDNDTAEVSAYDGTASLTISDVNQADDTEDDDIALTIDSADDYTDATTVSVESTQDGGDNDVAFQVANIDFEAEGGGDAAESLTVETSGTRAIEIDNIDMSDQGDNGIVNINAEVETTVTDIDFETTANDDDNGNTVSFAGSAAAVTYDLGDLTYDSDADDVVTGGDGDDTVSLDVADDNHDFTLSAFETLEITDSNAGSLDFVNTSDVETVELNDVTTGNLNLDNVASGLNIAVTDENDGDNIAIAAASAGATLNFSFADADEYDGNETFQLDANITTANFAVDSDDTDVDTITTEFASVSGTTVNITGTDADDTLALDFTIADTEDSFSVNTAVDVSHDAIGDTLDDDITLSYAGSAGSVALTLANTDIAEADSRFVGGDAEDDTLTVDIADSTAAATVEGFETISISDADGGTIDADDFSGVSEFDLDGIDTGNLTVNNADGDATVNVVDGGGNTITLDGSETDGEGLSVDITLEDDVTADTVTVTDIETVNISGDAAQTGLILDASDDEVDTINFSGENNITLAAGADATGAETVNINVEGTFDSEDDGSFAADANFNLNSANGNVDLDLAAGTAQTITFGSSLDDGETVTIGGFTEGGSPLADTLDLSALGITEVGDLDLTDDGNDTTIASSSFDGEIFLAGVVVADLANSSNFDFA